MEVREPSAKCLVGAMQKQTEAGLIPQDWAVCEVAQAFEICNQLRVPLSRAVRSGMSGPYPYYGPTGPQDWINEFRLEGEYALIGEDGDHFLKWKSQPMTLLVRGRFNVNNHAHVVKAIAENHTDWFRWFFASRDITQYLTRQGASRYKLTKGTLARLPCALPSPTEQRAISTALTDADALIESLEQLLTKKRQIKQGAMQELLTGKRRLPGFSQAWTLMHLGEIGRTYGGLTGKSKADFGRGDARYVTFMNVMANVRTSAYALESVQIASSESQNMVQPGDLLFNGSSETPEEVALCSWVESCEKNVFLNSFCFGFRPFVQDRISGLFMAYFFRARPGRNAVSSLAQGATRYNIAKTALLQASLKLPSFEEQKAIAETLSSMDEELAALESRLTKARALKQAMAQALLTGRIRLVEPTA